MPSYRPKSKRALDRRRRATLTGHCDCGAVAELFGVQTRGATCVTFVHDEDYPAGMNTGSHGDGVVGGLSLDDQ